MTPEKEKELKLFANQGRMNIIKETHACNSGHPGGSMSSIDLMTYLYNGRKSWKTSASAPPIL